VVSPLKVLTNKVDLIIYLVCFVSSGSGNLALFARGELSKVAMVISLPINSILLATISESSRASKLALEVDGDIHLVIEDL
jgi:hypothetical protein